MDARGVASSITIELKRHTEALGLAMGAKLGEVLLDGFASHSQSPAGRVAWLELRSDLVPWDWLAHLGGDIVGVEEQKLVLVDCRFC
jgi:hypothetical protein